jgi:hypothetical protein
MHCSQKHPALALVLKLPCDQLIKVVLQRRYVTRKLLECRERDLADVAILESDRIARVLAATEGVPSSLRFDMVASIAGSSTGFHLRADSQTQ